MDQLGPYRIGARLGRGGMGSVYEAVDTASGEAVAVKVLASHLADDPGLRARFRAEIETLKALRHPGIVQLLAFGEEDDRPYFVMELVRGKTLEQVLRSGRRFTWRETLATAMTVARALKTAHDHGVIHRDLKPSNLLVADGTTPGEGVKLADFGIAKLFGSVAHTAHGNIVGTAEYMAPEQAAGQGIDQRADLYALGLVMYAMLAGRPPFRGTQVTEVIQKQRNTPAPRVSLTVPGVPPELDALIDRLLAKDPADRPASALALVRLLTAIDAHVTDDVPAAEPVVDKLVISDLPPTRTDRTAPSSAATGENTTIVGPSGSSQGPAVGPPQGSSGDAPRTPPTAAPSVPFPAATPARATSARDDDLTRNAPASAAATTRVDAAVRSRHTTLAEIDRADAARRAAAESREAAWRWALATAIALAVVAAGWTMLRPRTADELYDRIRAAAADGGDLRDAETEMLRFLERHGDDPRAAEVAALERTMEVDRLERRARHQRRSGRLLTPIERDYRAAMEREQSSPSACVEALEAILALHPTGADTDGETALWGDLVRRQIARLGPLAVEERRQDLARIDDALAGAERLAREAQSDASRREEALAERRRLLESVVDTYASRPHAEEAVRSARALLDASAPTPRPEDQR